MKTFEDYMEETEYMEVPTYALALAIGAIPCPHSRDDMCPECERKTWDCLQVSFDYRNRDDLMEGI